MKRNAMLAGILTAALVSAAQAQQGTGTGRTGTQQGDATTQTGRQGANAGGQQTAGKAAVNDSLFMQAAAISGLAEVGLSELGLQRATDPRLKEFSRRMIDEHNKVNSELTTLAGQMQASIPRGIDARAAFCAQSLAGLSGEEFDKCYAKAQCVAHEDALAMFKAEAERGRDQNVRAFAARNVSHIEEHLRTIKPIAQKYESQEKGAAGSQPGAGSGSRQGGLPGSGNPAGTSSTGGTDRDR
ncbi:MAG: DUF4142 domain-containing protein [Isosphaeraceae bacterium]